MVGLQSYKKLQNFCSFELENTLALVFGMHFSDYQDHKILIHLIVLVAYFCLNYYRISTLHSLNSLEFALLFFPRKFHCCEYKIYYGIFIILNLSECKSFSTNVSQYG